MSGLPILDLQSDTSTTLAACGSADGVPPEKGKSPGASFSARSGRLYFHGKPIAQCYHQFGAAGGITTDSAAVAEALALTLNMAAAKAVQG